MAALVIAGLMALGLLIEVVVGKIAHDRTAAALTDAMGTSNPVLVRLHGRPLSLDLLRRRVPRVEVSARGVPTAKGGRISRLEVELADVRLPRGRDGEPDREELSARTGRFVAWIEPDDLESIVPLPPGVRRLELGDRCLRVVTAAGVAFGTSLLAESGDLVIRADRGVLRFLPVAEFRVQLGELPAGAIVEDVEVTDSAVVARGPLDGDRLVA